MGEFGGKEEAKGGGYLISSSYSAKQRRWYQKARQRVHHKLLLCVCVCVQKMAGVRTTSSFNWTAYIHAYREPPGLQAYQHRFRLLENLTLTPRREIFANFTHICI